MKKYFILALCLAVFLCGLAIFEYTKTNDGKLHLVICDVGQGDGILVRTPTRKTIVIDGGPDDKMLSCLSRHLPFWERTIDLMLLTHPHADHATGLIFLLNRYRVIHYGTEKVENPTTTETALKNILALKKPSATFLFSQDQYRFSDGTSFVTLWPDKEWFLSQNMSSADSQNLDINGFSLIELLQYGSFKALLTGDAGVVAEEQIASVAGQVDVLKVPHHGSRTGMSQSYLQTIRPRFAIISVGKGNKYGHPAPHSLELLKNARVKTYRTDEQGEVEIVTDGKHFSVKTEK